MDNGMHRPAAVAGAFYPASPAVLKGMLADMFGKVADIGPAPKAMILPHAGYIYSGEVAAKGYGLLRSQHQEIRRVVLLGPTHRVPVRGLATVSVDAFDTPLGSIPIDKQAIAEVVPLPQVTVRDDVHAQEHSLEVHLPFLQSIIDNFSLVPFAVGDATPAEVSEVLEKLWGGNETLIVISSDLSHFNDYETAVKQDLNTSRAIEELRIEDIDHYDACGATPVCGLLNLARQKHFNVSMIDYRNSGDTAGSKDSVVGYGAYILNQDDPASLLSDNEQSAEGAHYTWQDGQTLIALARRSIEHGLEYGEALEIDPLDFDEHLREKRASFVTLQMNGQLRGCIGSLEAYRPLVIDVAQNAWAAAFRDPRFEPLTTGELSGLDIHLSLLSIPEPMAFDSEAGLIQQLRPGTDGLILEDRGHRGTFLPSVWESLTERAQFWNELKRKAGLPYDHWSDTIKVSRYTTQAFP